MCRRVGLRQGREVWLKLDLEEQMEQKQPAERAGGAERTCWEVLTHKVLGAHSASDTKQWCDFGEVTHLSHLCVKA